MFVGFLLVFSILICRIYSSSTNNLKEEVTDEKKSMFYSVPDEIVRFISEYCDNPFLLRTINRPFFNSIPSAQTTLSAKFNSETFLKLPSTPELWHLIRFKGSMNELLKESCRHLPRSLGLIAEAITLSTMHDSVKLNPVELSNLGMLLNNLQLSELFVELQTKFRDHPFPIESRKFLISVAKIISSKMFKPSQAQRFNFDNRNLMGQEMFLISLFMSSLSIQKQVELVHALETYSIIILKSLVEAITNVHYHDLCFEKYNHLIHRLKLPHQHSTLLLLLIRLRFNSFSINLDQFAQVDSFLKPLIFELPCYDHFILASIEIYRLDILRMFLGLMAESNKKISKEIKEALFASPEILENLPKDLIKRVFSVEFYLEYHVMFKDFDFVSSTLTREDVLVSGYIHSNEQFAIILSDFRSRNRNIVELSNIFAHFLQDPRLIDNLTVFSDFIKTLKSSFGLEFKEISFDVLRIVILNYSKYSGLFENQLPTLFYIISSKGLAELLRDYEVYAILKKDHIRILRKLYCSFVEAPKIFTKYDWTRLLNLSSILLSLADNNKIIHLQRALQPLNYVPLSETLDFIKSNMFDYIVYSYANTFNYSQLKDECTPLLDIWEGTSHKQ